MICHATAPNAVDDDLRSTPVPQNETMIIMEATLTANDTGEDLAITGADATSSLGAVVSWDDDLEQITYDPRNVPGLVALAAGETADDTFTYTLSGSGGPDDTATVTLRVSGVNYPPVIGNLPPAPILIGDNESTSPFPSVEVSDPDNNEVLSVTVAIDDSDKGALSNLGPFVPGSGGIYTFSGSPADATTALRGLVFVPVENRLVPGLDEDTVLTVTVEDSGGLFDSGSVTVNVTSINDPPELFNPGPSSFTTTAGSSLLVFSQVFFEDVDVEEAGTGEGAGDDFTAKIVLGGGIEPGIIVSASFLATGGDTYEFTGKRDEVGQAIQNATYLAPNADGTFSITLTVEDSHGGISDPPVVITVLVSQPEPALTGLVQGQQLADTGSIQPFASATFNSFGSGNRVVEITLDSDEKGFFDILGPFTAETGGERTVYRMTGSSVAATDAIRNIRFRPIPNRIVGPSETVVITIQVRESAQGVILNETTLPLTVIPVNDPPTISSDNPEHRINDNQSVSPFTTTSIFDVDEGGQQNLTVSVGFTGQDPNTGLARPGGGVLSSQGGNLPNPHVFSGTPAEVTAVLQGLVFTPTPNLNQEGQRETITFTVFADDGRGGTARNSGVTVVVLSVEGAPVIQGVPPPSQQPFAVAGTADAAGILSATPFQGISVTDEPGPAGPEVLTFTITLDNADKGTLSGDGFTSSDGGLTYVMEGTPDAVTTALQALLYTLNPDFAFPANEPGRTQFTLRATDSAGNLTSLVFTITIRDRSAAHMVTVPLDNHPDDPVIAGSLREAIGFAENNDIIVFDFHDDDFPVTIRLQSELVIQKNLTIVGSGVEQLTISGDGNGDGVGDTGLFSVVNGARFAVEQLTLKNGAASSYGGAIAAGEGTTVVARDCVFSRNEAGQFGGAIDVMGGELYIEQCLFINNAVVGSTAQGGGAISIYSTGNSVIRNSTFAWNTQESAGGYGGGAIYAENLNLSRFFDLHIEHCTFADNLDAADGGSAVLAVTAGLKIHVKNNIFSDQQGRVLDVLGGGRFQSAGGNIATDGTVTTYTQGGQPQNVTLLNHSSDQRATDPQLLPLARNGGATPTIGLAPSSPAINAAVSPLDAPGTDQRGVWRGANPDIGAFEAGQFRRLNLNEIHADPPSGESPFVEFYNPRDSEPLNLQGLVFYVDGNEAHTFGDLEVSPGSGFSWTPPFPMDGERGTLSLADAGGRELMRVNYVTAFSDKGMQIDTGGQSINRYPRYEGGFLPHRLVVERVTGIAGGDLNSPGLDVDGSPLDGGNAPPVAVPNMGEFAVAANKTIDLPVLLNDIEFDRTDTLKIVEVMPVSSRTVVNQELLAIDGSGPIALSGLPPGLNETVDPSGVALSISADQRSLVYDPSASPAMIGLARGETVTDVWAYTIRDFDETGAPWPRGADDTTRVENIKRATAFFTVTVTGVNEPPQPGDVFVHTAENHALRMMADPDLLAPVPFNFGDLEADFQTFDSSGNPIFLKPLPPVTALLSNDIDVDSDDDASTLLLVAVHPRSTPEEGLVAHSEKGARVVLDIRANRRETSVLYDPRPSTTLRALAEGETTEDVFHYSVMDRHGAIGVAKVTVTVTGVNNVPTAADVIGLVANEDEVLPIPTGDVLANDTDPDANDVLAIQTPLPSVSELGAVLDFDGAIISYDPREAPVLQAMARNQSVVDSFQYTVTDGQGGTDQATVFITVEGRNDPPVADDFFLQLFEKETAVVDAESGLLTRVVDVDAMDLPWILPRRGVITPLGAGLDINPDGSLRYVADSHAIRALVEGETAVETFTYTVIDNSRLTASDDVFRLEANRENVALPVLLNDAIVGSGASPVENYGDGGSAGLVVASANHGLNDGLLVLIENYGGAGGYNGVHPIAAIDRDHFSVPVAFADDPSGKRGTWRPWFSITEVGEPDQGGELSLVDGQILLYTPGEDFHGIEVFTYRIEDGVGGQDVATVTVEVVLPPLNGGISASPNRFVIGAGGVDVEVDVLANDSILPMSGGALTIIAVDAADGAAGDLQIAGGGSRLRYTPPAPGFTGVETFAYTVSGGGPATSVATVTFEVVDRSGQLSGSDNDFFVATGGSRVLDVLANDADLPSFPVTSSLVEVGPTSAGGTAVIVGNAVEYTPPPAPFLGTDAFVYTARDASGADTTQTVRVRVVPHTVDFHAIADHFRVVAGAGPVKLPVMRNDGAVLNDAANLRIVNFGLDTNAPPDAARVRIVDGGQMIEYTPPAAAAEEVFTYEISIGTSARREAAITVKVVDAFATPPRAMDDFFHVGKNSGPHLLDVLANDRPLPDAGWEWTLSSVATPNQGGTVSIENHTALLYAPADGFGGTETFAYTIRDALGATSSATVTVRVGELSTSPNVFAVLENSYDNPLDVLANDDLLDRFGKDLTILTASPASQGGLVNILGSGPGNLLYYSPPASFSGEETFTYTVVDNTGGTREENVTVRVVPKDGDRDTAELRVEIIGVNDIPVVTGLEDRAITDKESVKPFAGVLITDPDEWGMQMQWVEARFDTNLGFVTAPAMTEISPGILRVTGTPSAVTAALRDFTFTPFENRIDYIDPGQANAVFDLSIDDGFVTSPVTDEVTVTITPVNDAPIITRPIGDLVLPENALPRGIFLPAHFADVDDDVAGGDLIWTVTQNTRPYLFNSLTVDVAKQLLVLDLASGVTGASDITVRGTDRGGLFVETGFQVRLEGAPIIDLAAGQSQPPAAVFVTATQSGFRRDYRQSFRVRNEGSMPVDAFVVLVSGLNQPVDGITLHAAGHSIDERGTPDDFSDDLTSSSGVNILQTGPHAYAVKYDVPVLPDGSVVVHLTYRASSINPVTIRPTIEIELTTASPPPGELAAVDLRRDVANADVRLSFSVEAGRLYELQYSGNLSDWERWAASVPPSAFSRRIEWVDDGLNTGFHPSRAAKRFYRLVDVTGP